MTYYGGNILRFYVGKIIQKNLTKIYHFEINLKFR